LLLALWMLVFSESVPNSDRIELNFRKGVVALLATHKRLMKTPLHARRVLVWRLRPAAIPKKTFAHSSTAKTRPAGIAQSERAQQLDHRERHSQEHGQPRRARHRLVTDDKFWNFTVHYEYMVPDRSNSGFYLRGRHEIQILGDYASGKPGLGGNGAIYQFKAPDKFVSKPAGEWQTVDATIIGNKITVVQNGVKIHDNVECKKATGSEIDNKIDESGPDFSARRSRHRCRSATSASKSCRKTRDSLVTVPPASHWWFASMNRQRGRSSHRSRIRCFGEDCGCACLFRSLTLLR
jgi:hypothetical protein